MFKSIDDVIQRFAAQQYISSRTIATVVYLAAEMKKPILVEGPAGVGKTELAKVLAGALDQELIRLECYEGPAPCARPSTRSRTRMTYSSVIGSSCRARSCARSVRRSPACCSSTRSTS